MAEVAGRRSDHVGCRMATVVHRSPVHRSWTTVVDWLDLRLRGAHPRLSHLLLNTLTQLGIDP